jgi:peptide/nickel transport system permease protein
MVSEARVGLYADEQAPSSMSDGQDIEIALGMDKLKRNHERETRGVHERLGWIDRRQRRLAASAPRLREAWNIFVQNRLSVVGCVLLLIYATLPIAYAGLRATVWNDSRYNPVNGFERESMPNPAPPTWISAEWLEPDDIHRFDRNRPSFDHLLGTDTLGRDVLSVLMASTVTTFIVGITAALTTAGIGLTIAALSAYYRGLTDAIFSHVSDAFLLIPPPIFMIAAGIFLQTQKTTLFEMVYRVITGNGVSDGVRIYLQPFEFGLIYGVIAGAGGAAIVLRSHGLKVMSLSFIEASRVAGASARQIILNHLIPHMLPLAAIYMMVIVTGAVVADGFLAFFGFNSNPLNWGTMIYSALTYRIINATIPWSALVAPATMISLFTAAFYMVSRGLHQVVEPRLRDDFVAKGR